VGDLATLMADLADLELLHPVVVNSRHELIVGERRLEAARQLGWKTIPVRVCARFDDLVAALKAELSENNCRVELSLSEKAAAARLEAAFKEEARQRQRSGKSADGQAGGRGKKKPPANFAGGLPPPDDGETRKKIAAVLGISHPTLSKAREVVEAAREDPERF